jgi:ribosomal protein L37AE/L43A
MSKVSEEKKDSDRCGICGGPAKYDGWLGIIYCAKCGAHETAIGWQPPKQRGELN